MEEQLKIKKHFTSQQALLKAEQYCAYQERCQQEVRDKLYEWGLHSNEVEKIISELITSDFLNEERFAKAYASGKFRIKKWGRIKIKVELKKRKISEYCIKKAMQVINEDDYLKTIKELIVKKSKDIKEKKSHIKNYKLAKYIASKGFEQNLIFELLKSEE